MADPTLTKLLQEQQRATQLIQASLDKLTAAKTASTRNPVKEPEPFKGESGDAQRFLRFFSNWATSNSELKDDDKKKISSALSYLQGSAGSWALQYLDQIAEHEAAATDEDKAKKPWPFGGKWSEFVVAFKKRFQPADQEKAAEAQLETLTQGRKSASQFAAEFMEIFPAPAYLRRMAWPASAASSTTAIASCWTLLPSPSLLTRSRPLSRITVTS
ncbi:hypothetical protein CC2G_007554 [Coprinopsis cinerea AmutBmut pab1-1]|nr:hypothetical protein CC2G_007554 [Coprinopsis cinerea AmutBmut pab1-1]